jgi:hypothetical protein
VVAVEADKVAAAVSEEVVEEGDKVVAEADKGVADKDQGVDCSCKIIDIQHIFAHVKYTLP